jgi:NADH-quinone oxidoreductase subunit M
MVPKIAFVVSGILFIYSLRLIEHFSVIDTLFQHSVTVPFLKSLNLTLHLGVDGLSLWFIILTTFLTPILIWFEQQRESNKSNAIYLWMLVLEGAVIGAFASSNLLFFYIFFELALIPIIFMLGIWGGTGRIRALLQFALFTFLGSLLMLVAILYIGSQVHSLEYTTLLKTGFSHQVQYWCFLAFAIAFLIKIPIFPFHFWLPTTYTEAPMVGTIFLSAILAKLGIYGFLRFCLPLFPYAAKQFLPTLLILASIGLIHASLLASRQKNMKSFLAYGSLLHMNFIALGVFTVSFLGLEGAIFQSLAHALSISALFLILGMMGNLAEGSLESFRGWAAQSPAMATLFFIALLAFLGVPGFGNFIGELFILIACYQHHTSWLGLVAGLISIVLSLWVFIPAFQKIFWGKSEEHDIRNFQVRKHEYMLIVPLIVLLIWMGLNPSFFLRSTEATVQVNIEQQMQVPTTSTKPSYHHKTIHSFRREP